MKYLLPLLALPLVACTEGMPQIDPQIQAIIQPQEQEQVQLTAPDITVTSQITEQWRGESRPQPWVIADMQIDFQTRTDHTYYLVYEGQQQLTPVTPPAISSTEIPGQLSAFDPSRLPRIQLRTCVQDNCQTSPVLPWDTSTLPIPVSLEDVDCPEAIVEVIQRMDPSLYDTAEWEHRDDVTGTMCTLRTAIYPEDLFLRTSFTLDSAQIEITQTSTREQDFQLNNTQLANCLILTTRCDQMLEQLP